jgi:nitrogen fixation protein NifU and related proteins
MDELTKRLRAIYSETTVDHILSPRNQESIPNADGYAACRSGCGEIMKIWLRVRNDQIWETGFWTNGCAATIACGSMCSDLLKGQSVHQALAITAQDIADALENLPEGNMHCAELAAGAAVSALKDYLAMSQQPWKKLYRK